MSVEGKWAIITGASSGIGKALALEFAAGGFNVLLTGRNEQALTELAAECGKRFHVVARTVPAELSNPQSTDQLIAAIQAEPRRYEVLVNNAGFGINGDFSRTDI